MKIKLLRGMNVPQKGASAAAPAPAGKVVDVPPRMAKREVALGRAALVVEGKKDRTVPREQAVAGRLSER